MKKNTQIKIIIKVRPEISMDWNRSEGTCNRDPGLSVKKNHSGSRVH